jgi:hypothetical protein
MRVASAGPRLQWAQSECNLTRVGRLSQTILYNLKARTKTGICHSAPPQQMRKRSPDNFFIVLRATLEIAGVFYDYSIRGFSSTIFS